ncbi:MAG TPA: hypothetical protein VK716_11065 [Terracidiphilus sp.]|jgi:hypothetical protein|nr:hypothetical protein [Terracidiphilus sp.]
MSYSTLHLADAIITLAIIAVDLMAITLALSGSLTRRLALAAVGGAWVGLALYLGASGKLAFTPGSPVPLVGVLLAIPLITAGVAALASAQVRCAFRDLPMHLLIGLNAMRILGVLFLLDLATGSLSGPFPWFAGLGDILTGALAIPLAQKLAAGRPVSAPSIAVWNALGTLDLLLAVVLGITTAPGSPLHLVHTGVGSQAMQYLPLSLVPTVLVPFYLVTHALVAARLRIHATSPAAPARNIAASSLSA